jgi:pilus assembly protein CpaE
MSEKIKVLIVDDLSETRQSVSKMLQFDTNIEVVGEAVNGRQAVERARELKPNVVLMDVNMPDMDGITATKAIRQATPSAQIIIMSVQSDTPYMRKAMLAGARDFLMKPFSLDELHRTVHDVYERRPEYELPPQPVRGRSRPIVPDDLDDMEDEGHVITVYSPKGGSGCTTVAINVAVTLAMGGKKTLLIDGSFQFGTVAVMLNLRQNTTILDLVERIEDLDEDLVGSVTARHASGLQVLLAPPQPEMADMITEDSLVALLSFFREIFDFIVIDTASGLDNRMLTFLERSDNILLVGNQSLTTLKTIRDFMRVMQGLNYESRNILLALNGVFRGGEISLKDVSDILKQPVVFSVPLDDESARRAEIQGKPLVVGPMQRRPIAGALQGIGEQLLQSEGNRTGIPPAQQPKKVGFLSRLFGRG